MSTTIPSPDAHSAAPTEPSTTSITQPTMAPKDPAQTTITSDNTGTDNSGGKSPQPQTTSTTTSAVAAETTAKGWFTLLPSMKDYLKLEFGQEYVTFVADIQKKGAQKKWIVNNVLLPFLDKFFEGETSAPIDAISKSVCRYFYNTHKHWADLKDTTLEKPKPRCISGKRAYQLANKELIERRARALKKDHETKIAEQKALGEEVANDSRSDDGWHHRALLAAWNDCPDQKKYEDEARAFNDHIKDGPELADVYARQDLLGAILESMLKPLIGFGHNGVGKVAFGVQVGYEDAQGNYKYHDQFILPDPDWLKLTPTGNIITEDTRKNFVDMVTAGFSLAKNPKPTDAQVKGTPTPQNTITPQASSTPEKSSPPTTSSTAPSDSPSGSTDVAPANQPSANAPSTTRSNDETLEARREAEAKERELAIREAEQMRLNRESEVAATKQSRLQVLLEKKKQEKAKKTQDMLAADAANLEASIAAATSSNALGELTAPVSSDGEAKLKAVTDMDLSAGDDKRAGDSEDFEARLKAVEMELDSDDDEAFVPQPPPRPRPRPTVKKTAEPPMPTPPPPPPVHVDASTVKVPEAVDAGAKQSVPEPAPRDELAEMDDESAASEIVEETGKKRGARSTKRKAVEAPADEPAAKTAKTGTRMTRAAIKKAEEEERKAAELEAKQAKKAAAAAKKKKTAEEKKGANATARKTRRR